MSIAGNLRRKASHLGLGSSGVSARLFLAFIAISGFAILAAAAGILAFREVGGRLALVDARIPPTLSALELSRSAERIIAVAPTLLVTAEAKKRDEIKAALISEARHLNETLAEVKSSSTKLVPLLQIEPVVSSFLANLAALEDLVARRLAASERLALMRGRIFEINYQTQRLLAPWLQVVEEEIAALLGAAEAGAPDFSDATRHLVSKIKMQQLLRTVAAQVSTLSDRLSETSTAVGPRRLSVLTFQTGLILSDLESHAAGFDPKLRPLFFEKLTELHKLAEGQSAIAEARRQELALIATGEELLRETGRLSAELTAAVDELGAAAKRDIGEAIGSAVSLQELSTRVLIVVSLLTLLTSILIVWLYVGRSIAHRLAQLSEGMLAIAAGSIKTPVAVEGTDEIAAMARAVEIFRRNTLERDALLVEKAAAAEHLEKEVKQRTTELAQSVEELRALGEVIQAVNSTVDLDTVLSTIVAKAVQLSNTEAGTIYVYDEIDRQMRLRATYGLDGAMMEEIERQQSRLSETALGEAVTTGRPVQIPDVRSDSSLVLGAVLRAGYRALLLVPLLAAERIIGALVVRHKQPGAFSKNTVELLQTFASQSVLAIQNAHLFTEVEEKRRQLEIASKYKSHFLASASHDLRQPLHALNLFIAQLRTTTAPHERRRLLTRITAAVNSMNELFEALLDMSKLDAGVLEKKLGAFPMQPLLARIETTFAELARQKGLSLRIVPSSASVRSDFILLERILLNLVSNAVRYTMRGGVVVGCRRRRDELRIDVCDSGPGIAPEQQRSIFAEFVQLPSLNLDRGSFGLGLSIVDRLGRFLGHRIELASHVGRGSRFSITVPLVGVQGKAAQEPLRLVSAADPARGKRILVIDDDPLVLDGMAGILRSWGCEVITAASSEAALGKLSAATMRPHLMISDYRLAAGETGIAALERLRRELGAAVPAFLVSGDTAPQGLREASERGYQLLHKPVTPMRLRAMLNRLLKESAPESAITHAVQNQPSRPAAKDRAPRLQ